MILDNKKGLTNQRSCALTGLQLAGLLGWAVMIPAIVSPLDCNHDTGCYQYSRFQKVNFSEIYDLDHFVQGAARLGITVYHHVPDGYEHLPDIEWPCAAQKRCRDTFDGLVDNYKGIAGKYLVAAPGIAASVVDSRRTAEDMTVANQVFQHSSSIQRDAKAIMRELERQGTVVAIHFRFEPDAEKVNYSGDMGLFSERLVHFLAQLSSDEPFVLYFVTAMTMESIGATLAVQRVLQRFPGTILTNKQTCKSFLRSLGSDITFVHAALDFEVSLRANYFVGFVQSSFSSFIALGRYDMHKKFTKPHTIMVPSQKMTEICKLEDLHIWQFELQLPFNECFISDPCALLMRMQGRPDTQRSCKIPANSLSDISCTGLTGWSSNCENASPFGPLKTSSSSESQHYFYNPFIEGRTS